MKTGIRGCCGQTKRHGVKRLCAQKAIVTRNGKCYCFYHDPLYPHRFGERARVTRATQEA